ncbi:MAG TPA: pectin acetylesterase-family hydrolase [Polyangiaceae bacterium]|nr:pectin acetylesterase-family hydrolase [Polyangiaceae bacterium]
MKRSVRTAVLLLAAGAATLASYGCGGSGSADKADASLSDATGAPTAETGTPADRAEGGKGALLPCVPDASAPIPPDRCTTDPNDMSHPQCGAWIKVELPGTVCGDGSQFKFFVNYSNTSNDVEVHFEPGGACWDYASCSGAGGVRGAANPHGIPDDHMSQYQYLNLLRRTTDNPAQDYNMVFVSYCTGDVHTGNNVITYVSEGGAPDGGAGDDGGAEAGGDGGPMELTFHHAGHANTLAVIDWIHKTFPTIPRLFMTGCSAGGAGAILNYPFMREGLGSSVQCSYLLDDSGPIFHSDGPSKQLHETIRSAWNVDPILQSLSGILPVSLADLQTDFGLVNVAIAQKYPHDRLSLTAYRMDLNYSLYSYQRFFPGSTEAQIHAMWWQDLQELMATYDAQANLAYYIPFFRSDNCSHCVSIPPIGNAPIEPTDDNKVLTMPWAGSEIREDMIDLKQFCADLLDDTKPLKSYLQAPQNASFAPAVSAMCMQGG